MVLKALLLALIAALLAVAELWKIIVCGRADDVADAHPTCKITATPGRYQSANLNISKWIWTGENPAPGGTNPIGTRVLRKNITTPCGKCAVCATIVIAADDSHNVFVNGVAIGAGGGWTKGQALFTALKPSANLFAIAGYTGGGPAGVIATILVHYSDGTRESFITDESWRTILGAPPNGFQLPSTSDSLWNFAALQGSYPKSLWGQPSLPPVLPLTPAKWIWTSDNVNGSAPVGSRAFRKTVNECSKVAVCATVLILADNHYTLYVNGKTIGSGSSYTVADAYSIPNLQPTFNTFAINATNDNGPAGVIATILITYRDGTNETIVTDSSWKASKTIGKGFELPFAEDSDWEDAKVVGAYGVRPWGSNIAIPRA